MKTSRCALLVLALALFQLPVFAAKNEAKERLNPSQRLDAIIEKNLKAQKLKPNPMASDEIFVRRIYLDIIGRTPTKQEAVQFFNATAKNKRSQLVDRLLNSEGYVHHFYTYWADLLRAKTQISGAGNSQTAGYAYHNWIKNALRENKPYDEMVHELVTAKGKTWENGAVGFYLRDYGMPLDNMAITTQVFLGTQIVCAQCHNHPFDTWTQMDYYHLSAFTYGMTTTNQAVNGRAALALNKDVEERRTVAKAMSEILKPLRFNTVLESDRKVRLPHDYQYSDSKPKAVVQPTVPWGKGPTSRRDMTKPPIQEFADWMTSPENKRFTRVIANRLFKKAMGRGVIEPVDDMRDDTKPSNPELMAYLENRMRNVDYDMKKFLRSIYTSRSYQREASPEEVASWQPYHFAGPTLRRLTAEQIWDSMGSMIIDDFDKPNARAALGRQRLLTQTELIAKGTLDHSPEDMLAFAKTVSKKQVELSDEINQAVADATVARESEDPEQIQAALRKVGELRGELAETVAMTVFKPGLEAKAQQVAAAGEAEEFDDDFLKELALIVEDGQLMEPEAMSTSKSGGFDGGNFIKGLLAEILAPKLAAAKEADAARQKREIADWGLKGQRERSLYKIFERQRKGIMRASEIRSPAPNGHFLREFGQSDRELVENANDQASITQALSLLNGQLNNKLMHSCSVLYRDMRGKKIGEKLDTIYLTLLSRKPTMEEQELLLPMLGGKGTEGLNQVIWTLLNTRQFMFVQ